MDEEVSNAGCLAASQNVSLTERSFRSSLCDHNSNNSDKRDKPQLQVRQQSDYVYSRVDPCGRPGGGRTRPDGRPAGGHTRPDGRLAGGAPDLAGGAPDLAVALAAAPCRNGRI